MPSLFEKWKCKWKWECKCLPKTVPNHPEETASESNHRECAICRDESQTTQPHTCPQCCKNAWFICPQCQQELQGKPCPMCRKTPRPDHGIDLEDGASPRIRRHCLSLETRRKCNEISGCFYYLVRAVFCFFLCQYLGKCYYWVYCSGTCGDTEDKCACGRQVSGSSYWGNFDNAIPEACGGLFVTGVIVGCCLKNSDYRINNY